MGRVPDKGIRKALAGRTKMERHREAEEDKGMRIYISGPITGTRYYMERFRKAEEKLTAAGHTVYNPAKVNSCMPEGTKHEEYMKVAMTLLEMADAIYLLKDWQKSCGANREYGYALGKDYVIMEEE